MIRALLGVLGLGLGAIVALGVWSSITAEPLKYNTSTRAGQAIMWLDADLEGCDRVDNALAEVYGAVMTPKHFMYNECNYLRDPNVDIIEKYVYVMVGR